jgi:hypothetical protein
VTSPHILCCALSVAAVLLARAGAQPTAAPVLEDGFESDLSHWIVDRGKQPLVLSSDRAFEGKKCAYSGPPGTTRAGKREFGLHLIGRVELRFYDDMAPRKQQMAGVSAEGGLLGIACRGGKTYQYRIRRNYLPTDVARSEGWHLFAWEANGSVTEAFIDGTKVAENAELPRLERVFVGSFWDNSTGWYDSIRVWRKAPDKAPPFTEAERLFAENAPEGRGIRVVNKQGASEKAINHWDTPGHVLEWVVGVPQPGPGMLLVKYATASASAIRLLGVGEKAVRVRFPGTGGWDKWAFQGIPLETSEQVAVVRMKASEGSLNVDWLAVAPAPCEPSIYGRALDLFVRERQRLGTVSRMLSRAAQGSGVPIPAPVAVPELREKLPGLEELQHLPEAIRRAGDALRESIVVAERPKLDSIFRVPEWTLPKRETELSQEYLNRLAAYLNLTAPRFRDWPHAPGCRYHKREGSREWDVRQNATVALGYAALLRGPTSSEAGGVPVAQLNADLAGLLRTISITHKVNFLPTRDGVPWGDQWQSAFWAGIAGQAAWLVWARLPDDVRLMIARMVEHEANRFNERRPDSGVERDTKAEENAWNSEVIALAACMFPGHPSADKWHERAIVYMLNSFSRQSDLTSDQVVDGRPLKERLTAVTIHPDFSLENHNRVHPDYLTTGSLMLRNALLYRAAGRPIPESTFFNVPETYALVKGITATNGSCFYVNGQDWWPHRHDVPLLISGLMSVLRNDPEAAFIERATLAFTGRMHARFKDGSMWDRREYNYANAEEEMIARYAELYLFHRTFGDGPPPTPKATFLAEQSGVRVYDRGGFVTHRTPTKFVSLAWKNGAMGLVFPRDDTWFTAPYERGLVGTITCRGKNDSRPVLIARKVVPQPDSFAAAVRLSRCDGAVEQQLAVVSFPEDRVVILEQLVALEPIVLDRVATGAFGILNEDAPGISPNRRVLHHAGGRTSVDGACAAKRTHIPIPSTWINIDDRFGVVASASRLAYLDHNAYQKSRLREILHANAISGPQQVSKGDIFSQSTWLVLPNATAETTQGQTIALRITGELPVACLSDGTEITANFAAETKEVVEVDGQVHSLRPLDVLITGR